ncbi:hypothetical protein EDD18DRAFT_1019478, partial [Armillaria luteobubalina]
WAIGHTAKLSDLRDKDPSFKFVMPSAIKPPDSSSLPCLLTIDEIHKYPKLYAQAAANTAFKSGFNSVKIHSANG